MLHSGQIALVTTRHKMISENLKNPTKKHTEDKMKLIGIPECIFEPEEELFCSNDQSKIVQFYKNKCVLVTGATGFFGKLIVEKLLRSCVDIDTIFIVVREKGGKNMKTRIDELYNDVVFSVLARKYPKFKQKICGIEGDIGLPYLGIRPNHRKMLLEKVDVIIHCAATVKFDEKLKAAVQINVRGTKDMLELARDCHKLQSFVYVGTAFSYCIYKHIEEKFYKPPCDTEGILNLVEKVPDEILEKIAPQLIGKFPNTYAYTKAIAEDTVREYGQGLPICVFRPSIVVATYKEPLKSWIDNLYGPTGVVVGAGTGVLRSLHCDKECVADLVPGDMVINGIIAASYKKSLQKTRDIPIYNYVSSVENPVKWGDYLELTAKFGLLNPTVMAIWYYGFKLNKNGLAHRLYVFLLHNFLALLLDTLALATGRKPQLFKVYKKIDKFCRVMCYFGTQQWTFTNDNTQALWKELEPPDRSTFFFSIKEMDWEFLLQTHFTGIRVYLIKDNMSTLPQARIKWRRLMVLHYIVKYSVLLLLLRIVYALLSNLISTVFRY